VLCPGPSVREFTVLPDSAIAGLKFGSKLRVEFKLSVKLNIK